MPPCDRRKWKADWLQVRASNKGTSFGAGKTALRFVNTPKKLDYLKKKNNFYLNSINVLNY